MGSLGLPGTDWAGEEALDAGVHARGLSALLWELMERGELRLSPAVCVVLLGFGSGANAILSFAGAFLTDAKFSRLRECTRFLVLINPFPAAPETSSETQQIKKQLHILKKTLEKGAHHEQLQSLAAAIFSAEYIAKVSGLLAVAPLRILAVHTQWVANATSVNLPTHDEYEPHTRDKSTAFECPY